MKLYRLGFATLIFRRADTCILAIKKGGDSHLFIDFYAPRRWLRLVRRALPYFYAIGLRDCDSGGRVVQWSYDWCWNFWDQRNLRHRWCGAGDGEVYSQISIIRYLSSRKRVI